jgi:folate-binding protein YgfZ
MPHSGPKSVVATRRPFTTLSASGPDAISWLNGLLTCDVGKLAEGVGAWGLLLTKRGKIVAETFLVQARERLLIGTPGSSSELCRLLDDFLVMEDVTLEDQNTEHGWIQLHGASAAEIAPLLARYDATWARVDGLPLGGAVVVVPHFRVDECLADLSASKDRELLDQRAWHTWRVAHGVPEFGVDFGPDDNPHQAGLERRAVNWTKGCYLGQEVVCMQDMRGKVKRSLAKLTLPEGVALSAGDALSSETGECVGSVTSVADASPPGSQRAAIARLQAPHFEPGRTVYVGQSPLTTAALWACPTPGLTLSRPDRPVFPFGATWHGGRCDFRWVRSRHRTRVASQKSPSCPGADPSGHGGPSRTRSGVV